CAFAMAQLIATFIAVYVDWPSKSIQGCGWTWAGIIWIWDILCFPPLHLIKFILGIYFQDVEQVMPSQTLIEEQRIHHKNTNTVDSTTLCSTGNSDDSA
ncbi:unnamed protein product, partial [Rotaria sp. Silwood1]